MNLLEPWILFRLASGLVAALLFARTAWTGIRVLRFFHLRSVSEGQLALERQAELAATSARVGAVVATASLLLSAAAADRLTPALRGAMCGYGVVHANAYGPTSIVLTVVVAIAAFVHIELLALDRRTRSLALARPLAIGGILLCLLTLVDLSFASWWLGGLDLGVVASCCSTGADAAAAGVGDRGAAAGPRVFVTALSIVVALATIALAVVGTRRPRRGLAVAVGALAAVLLPAGALAIVLEVAPHVYEVPHHRCPYCLLRGDAWYLGYPLFGALIVGVTSAVGVALGALLARRAEGEPDPFPAFAAPALSRTAVALGVALALAAFPVLRYAWVSDGAALFR